MKSRGYHIFRVLRTFLVVNIGWYFDRCTHLSDAFSMLLRTLTQPVPAQLTDGTLLKLGITGAGFAILAAATVILFTVSLLQERGVSIRSAVLSRPLPQRWLLLYALLVFTILFYVPNALTGFIYAAF